MKKSLAVVAALVVCATFAHANLLFNGDFETGNGAGWNGGTPGYPHAGLGKNNPYGLDLGNFFTFNNGDPLPERQYTSQMTSETFTPGATYELSAAGTVGGGGTIDDGAEITLKIGYLDIETPDYNTFQPLATATTDLRTVPGADTDWVPLNVATFTAPADLTGLPYDGKKLSVEITITDVTTGVADDVWFDAIVLTPEPTSLVLLALGALIRRR